MQTVTCSRKKTINVRFHGDLKGRTNLSLEDLQQQFVQNDLGRSFQILPGEEESKKSLDYLKTYEKGRLKF